MNFIKKLVATILCVIFVFSFSVSAESAPHITLSRVDAMPGETVTIDISISNNPGIMCMSFCITYDNDAFEYIDYSKGYLKSYSIKNHTEKGQIAFVTDGTEDNNKNGIMLSVNFKIKNTAAPGWHTITIANQNREKYGNKLHNSFSNSNLKFIVPTVTAGSINVGETCENAGHKYGGWQLVSPADCTNTGLKNHTCIRCNFLEEIEIPITHNFEDDWTVDKVATPTEDGVMSRHCKNCDAVTDEITFAYEEVEDNQKPDSDSTNSNTASKDEGITNNDSSINNVLGSKNPLSSVENLKDYQDNIKPNSTTSVYTQIENNISTESSVESDVDSSNQSLQQDSNNEQVDNNDTADITNNKMSTTEIIVLILSSLVSVGIIIFAIILIIKRKKEN